MLKWIGAHIFDLKTFIRGGLWLKNLSSSTSTTALVVDANGQVGTNASLGGGGGGGGAGALHDVVDDTSPQLGGDLDINGNKIVSTSNQDIELDPNGTGNIILGNFTFDGDQTVGVSQDNYVLTYDNSTGLISLEAVAAGSSTDSFVISDQGGGIITMSTSSERKRSPFNGENATAYSTNLSANDYQKTGLLVPVDSELKEIRIHTRGYDSGTYTCTFRIYRKNFVDNAAGTSTLIQTIPAVTISGTTVLREQSLTGLSDAFSAGDHIYLTHQADAGYNNKRFILIGATYWFEKT